MSNGNSFFEFQSFVEKNKHLKYCKKKLKIKKELPLRAITRGENPVLIA